jgi:sulfate adenylyltransferase subunit 1
MNRDHTPFQPTGVVRFITCGSVDDGKSTLIGRLLVDAKAVLADQIQALSKTRHARSTAHDVAVDLALLTDGLEAEREQGITIDVAYRYFATPRRKFIVADAPGHEQYTRNMVTGASQSDVALLLVDATRVDLGASPVGLLPQTKRHAALVRMLGLRHVAVVVNKMDLLGFDPEVFSAIRNSVNQLGSTLGLESIQAFPVSALMGDNVASSSERTPWYTGPHLLEWLESIDLGGQVRPATLRLPVQWVARQDGSSADDLRGYVGRLEAGQLKAGQALRILPSQLLVTLDQVHRSGGVGGPVHRQEQAAPDARDTVAQAGDVIAWTFKEDVDVSRGDMLVEVSDETPVLSRELIASLCWLDHEPLSLARKYLLRHTTREVFAKVKSIHHVLDIQTLSHGEGAQGLAMNDIGEVALVLQKPIVADAFEASQATGCFVLIDEVTHHTVAAGLIRKALP